jgi:hypothetical protein
MQIPEGGNILSTALGDIKQHLMGKVGVNPCIRKGEFDEIFQLLCGYRCRSGRGGGPEEGDDITLQHHDPHNPCEDQPIHYCTAPEIKTASPFTVLSRYKSARFNPAPESAMEKEALAKGPVVAEDGAESTANTPTPVDVTRSFVPI